MIMLYMQDNKQMVLHVYTRVTYFTLHRLISCLSLYKPYQNDILYSLFSVQTSCILSNALYILCVALTSCSLKIKCKIPSLFSVLLELY